MAEFLDRANYYPIEPHTRMLACLGCGLLLIDDDQAIELHSVFHRLIDPPKTPKLPPQAIGYPGD